MFGRGWKRSCFKILCIFYKIKSAAPIFYSEMIKSVKKLKGTACNYALNYNSTKSCESYALLVKPYEIRPKIESNYVGVGWREVYKMLHQDAENSELRVLTYKIPFDTWPCNQRFNNLEKIKSFVWKTHWDAGPSIRRVLCVAVALWRCEDVAEWSLAWYEIKYLCFWHERHQAR